MRLLIRYASAGFSRAPIAMCVPFNMPSSSGNLWERVLSFLFGKLKGVVAMRKVLVLLPAMALLCLPARAMAGPECLPSGIAAICDALAQCLAAPVLPGGNPDSLPALRKAAREGDGNGVSIDGKASCLSYTATSGGRGGYQWDNWTQGCDSGNMRLAGCTAWKAFQARRGTCAPDPNQWACD